MIHFQTIQYKNLLSSGNAFTHIQLDQCQNTILVGRNGYGKSTILDALCFALFGRPFRKITKPNLVNSINQKNCVVEVTFQIGPHQYLVRRGLKPALFEIYCDTVLVNQNAESRDYQDYLETHILKFNYKSFTQIVILGTASFTPFMQLSQSDRRVIIEELLDIRIFSSMNGVVKERMAARQVLLSTNRSALDSTRDKIAMQESYLAKQHLNISVMTEKAEEDIAHNMTELSRLNDLLAISQTTKDRLHDSLVPLGNPLGRSQTVSTLKGQLDQTYQKHLKETAFLETHDHCPTCQQGIDGAFKTTKLRDLTEKVTQCQAGLLALQDKVEGAQALMDQMTQIQRQIQQEDQTMVRLMTSAREVEKFTQVLRDRLVHMHETHQAGLGDRSLLLALQQELVTITADRKLLLDDHAYDEAAMALFKDTGLKTKIIHQYLPIINTLVNKYLASMDFFVQFYLDDTFKETIKSRFRDEFTYDSFSEGEKNKIDMALLLTWREVARLKNSVHTNLLILDEIFDSSLDTVGTDELMRILQSLQAVNLLVISHRGDALQDKFQRVIRFTKQQNFSRLVEELP